MDNSANIVCLPCMHLEFCTGCASQIHSISMDSFNINKKINVDIKCPRCKGDVDELLYIFT